jgi:hypothetical protein
LEQHLALTQENLGSIPRGLTMEIVSITPAVPLNWCSIKITGHCPYECSYCVSQSKRIYHPGLFFMHDVNSLDLSKIDAVEITGGEPLTEPNLQDFLVRLKSEGKRINLLTAGSSQAKCEPLRTLGADDHVLLTHHLEKKNHKAVENALPNITSDVTIKVLGYNLDEVQKARKRWGVRTIPGIIDIRPLATPPEFPEFPDWLSVIVKHSDGTQEKMHPEDAVYRGITRTNGWKCSGGRTITEWFNEGEVWCGKRALGRCQAEFCNCDFDLLAGPKIKT